MVSARLSAAAALAVMFALGARAAGADDLDRIPSPAPSPQASASAPKHLTARLFAEDAATATALRGGLVVPFPSPLPASWENRSSLDSTLEWSAGRLGATFSNRLNLTESSAFAFPSNQTPRDDLRELSASLALGHLGTVDAGRINVRNGVALGFNPTDFFKTRTSVDQASLDPTVIRQDRLGVVLGRLQASLPGGSAELIVVPKLAPPSALAFIPRSGFNPRLDETNGDARYELALSGKLSDLAPQLLVYGDGSQLRFGFNASHEASTSVVLYGEWAGGAQPDLIARALAYGKVTGTLPAAAPSLLPDDPEARFRNDASLGASWTGENKITVDIEYEYHQGGLSAADWRNWTAQSALAQRNPSLAGQLWYLRGYANAQQEPFVRDQLFLRIDRPDAFVPHLELSGFAFVNLFDGSLLAQLSANYDLSDWWSFALFLNANAGGGYSERGSNPQARGATAELRRYL